MSFLSQEVLGGKPVELYIFQFGTLFWRYTDGRSAIVVNGLPYQAGVLSRSSQVDSQEESQSAITVTLDRALPVVSGMLVDPSNYRQSTLTILRYQPGGGSTALVGKGRISSIRWRGPSVEVTVSQSASLLQAPVPRLTFLPTCNHVVYDAYCQKNPADYTFAGIVQTIYDAGDVGGSPDGPSLLIATGAPSQFTTADYFKGGYFTVGVPDVEPRFIIAHTVPGGTQALLVSMSALPRTLAIGDTVQATAGCDGSIGTCTTKFANLANFFGFPYTPTKNPFTQGLG